MSLSTDLRAARALIARGWCINQGRRETPQGYEYCALGAIGTALIGHCDRQVLVETALGNVLKRRFDADTLPPPVFGGCGSTPHPWSVFFTDAASRPAVIAQFNNSTSQQAVLELFDEAIADAEQAEGIVQKPLPNEIINLLGVKPSKELVSVD